MTTQLEPVSIGQAKGTSGMGRTWSRRPVLLALTLTALGSVVVAIGLGPVQVAPATVLQVIGHHTIGVPGEATWERTHDAIIWDFMFANDAVSGWP